MTSLLVIFRAFFYFIFYFQTFFLISPENPPSKASITGKPTVCIKSLNILSFS